MKKCLISGATGFIGRNLAMRLAADPELDVIAVYHRTVPFEHPRLRWIQADLAKADEVKEALAGVDIVCHAAATTSGARDIVHKPQHHVTDNAVMTSLLFREAHEQRVGHVVFFSCSVMYGSQPWPVKESDFDPSRPLPHNYFGVGWTKIYLEKMAEFYAGLGHTRFSVIRHSNIYGPWDKFDLARSHVFGATMTKVLTASDGQITVWGDGTETRDLLYVSDLVDYVEIILKKQATSFDLTNVGLGTATSIRDLVHLIIECSGRSLEVRYDTSKPTIRTQLCLDIGRAKALYDWLPQVSLEAGIRKTMDWYLTHLRAGGE